ncbi:hypothetical protein U1Q18_012493 [Sarracenia purpurea var. burkii]
MELKVSSPKAGGLSPSDCVSDPEEKEISDDDDDDRNHKHRRRETRSQSLEREALEQVLVRPYRKRNKPFENGHLYRENNSQSSETWRSYNASPLEKDLSVKFEKRRLGLSTFPRAPNKVYQSFSDLGSGRGRGRESGSWSQLDPRFNIVDIASQIVQQGSVTPSLFAGRGLPNVSNSQGASWNAFGLMPGIPNGGMDTLHSLGLQGMLRPSISPSLNIGIPRQRCRDFEERGFCLRGDMCPMEHGVNRIVVEDVQSLSQFNLPVSLPSAHLLGTPSALPSVSAPSSSLINSKNLHGKSSKPGMTDDGLGMNSVFSGSAGAGGADFYDPDQPLWTNDRPETSSALLGLNSCKLDETESLLDGNSSDHARLFDVSGDECRVKSTATAVGSQSTSSSVWGRIGTKSRLEMKDKTDCTLSSSNCIENEAKEDQEPLANLHGASRQGNEIITENIGSKAINSSLKMQGDTGRNTRKPSQKALCTLFVNAIPQKDNKREALLSHFQKFGEVTDIYIPLNSERAFVQFSKRDEAEAALMAPDAVMGNRFIKLWWANRDSVPVDGMGSDNGVSLTPRGIPAVSVPPPLSVTPLGRDNLQSAAPKIRVPNSSVAVVPASDHPKPLVTSSPKATPPLQKKLESLELLKVELRKKQELLDQKRHNFRQQLDKFEKQATGSKGDIPSEQASKRQKPGPAGDIAKAATPRSSDPGTVVVSRVAQVMDEKNKSPENVMQESSKQSVILTQEPSRLKHSIRPLAPAGPPFVMNRFKLDNRPTAFKIIPPLPTGLAHVAALKEHFSAYGDLSAVEVKDGECSDPVSPKNCSAHVSFTTRHSAESAFTNGKCWQGHNLQFMWLASSNPSNDSGSRENSPSTSKTPSDANPQPPGDATAVILDKVADSDNGESKNPQRSETGKEQMEREEN